MTTFARVTASAEAFDHPAACTEPATGSVVEEGTASVTITNASGNTKALASTNQADLDFPSHGHSTDTDGNCTDSQSHTLDPSTVSSSVTVNGGGVYLVQDNVGTDPVSGGSIDIIDSGSNNSVTES